MVRSVALVTANTHSSSHALMYARAPPSGALAYNTDFLRYDSRVSVISTLEGFGISGVGFVFLLAFGAFGGMVMLFPQLMAHMLGWFFALSPVWLPIFLCSVFWNLWIAYRRAQFIVSQDVMVLEIKIPREIEKSPRAMELVFAGLAISSGEGTFIDRWINGKVRPWFSFEIVSIGGRIHFFIWTRRGLREIIEAQIYAQYPNVEINEADDYAMRVRYESGNYLAWGCDFKLTRPDPYPIKTYVEYELDRDPKEEYKIDPIAHLFEFLSTLKPGEQVWYQIMIRTNKDKRHKHGTMFGTEDRWKSEAEEEMKKIKDKATSKTTDKDGNERAGIPHLSPIQTDQIKAIERSLGKQGYDVGIRAVYAAEKTAFRAVSIGGMTGVFRQFSSSHLNSIAPTRWMTKFDYPWQDFRGMRKERTVRKLFDAYRRRSWFHPPHFTPHFVMTTEELATIFHFPSRGIQAPGLDRIPARKAEAPPNLPTA
ncbi:MAG: hypothetical protein AAB421_01890 [Patescibacteria group bacterium]